MWDSQYIHHNTSNVKEGCVSPGREVERRHTGTREGGGEETYRDQGGGGEETHRDQGGRRRGDTQGPGREEEVRRHTGTREGGGDEVKTNSCPTNITPWQQRNHPLSPQTVNKGLYSSLRTVVMPPDLRLGITMGSYNGAARPSPGQVCTVRHMGLILGDQDSCVTSL